MKRIIEVLCLSILFVLVLCGCENPSLSIDGVPTPEPAQLSASVVYSGSEGAVCVIAHAQPETPEPTPTPDGIDDADSLALLYAPRVRQTPLPVAENASSGSFPAGSLVAACAAPAEDYAFFCWTSGGTLDAGGSIVSYAKEFVFPIEEETTLYANFRPHGSSLVRYHANGGAALQAADATAEAAACAMRETESGQCYWDDFSLAYFLYPNALADLGYFERDGYVLVGYNTEPDESGEFFNLGGKILRDTDEVIELWCVWRQISPDADFDFTYSSFYGGWSVSGWHGDSDEVVIPPSHENEPVVSVEAGAFAGNENVTGIVFPKTVRQIADGACSDMPNLRALVLFDSLDYVSDASFANDYGLYTVFFSAATPPHYTHWFNNHAKKIELMYYYRDSERPKMIILGGSSTTYAVDAQQLESLLDRDYLVLNCASNGANLFNMTSDWAMRYMNEGDFLLQIIEYSFWQLGGVQCTWETFRSFESCYNVFSWVRAGKYSKLFDSFNDYLYHRKSELETDYESYVSNLAGTTGYYDDQGTLTVVTKPNGSPNFWKNRSIYFGDNFLYDFMVYYSNVQYWKLDQLGIGYAMAFTPLNRNSLYSYQTDEAMEDFERYLHENLNTPIISDLQENILDPEVFFDDDYHIAAPERTLYTERLARDLNAYFAEQDGSPKESPTEE